MFAIASQEKPFPTAADFAKAVQKVVPKNTSPTRTTNTKQEKVKTQLCNSVTVSPLSHPRYGDSGVIEADAPNNYQQIVTFSDGERLLVNNADLADLNDAIVSESSGRTYPKEYSEAMSTTGYVYAALEERHKQELERPGFDFLQECWNDDPAKADCDQEIAGEVSAVGNCLCGWGVG
ncbi:hypothetical protein [Nostoc sp.]|uniref:hypothetical protein n=1 Tax=Nostoc sp. TaxID=1180 RepID=UPI002FF764A7